MPEDDDPDRWVTDWDEIDGEPFDDDELLDDELLDEELIDDELFEDEYLEEPEVRPTRLVPLAAARHQPRDADDRAYDVDDDDYDDAVSRRARALLVVACAVVFVLVGVALAAVLIGQDDDLETDAAASSSSSTTRATPSSLGALPGQQPAPGVSSTIASGSSSTSSTKATTSTTKAATTTSTEPPDGPACSPTGTTRSPEPGNLPMKVAFCVDDPTPKVGQSVTLSGTAEDLDGGVTVDCVKVSWEGEEFGECYPSQSDPPASYNESYTFKHTFTTPGSYSIHVGAQSGEPNGSFAEAILKITVHA